MKLGSLAAFAGLALLGQTALAQPAPTAAPPAPTLAPAPLPYTPPAPPSQPAPVMVAPAPYAAPPYPQGYPPPAGYSAWGSEQAPTVIGPDGRPRLLPLEMKYDPDKGIPNGYRVVPQRRTTLAIAGGSVFGGLWIASAIAGGVMEDSGKWSGHHGWPMYIPVIGPLITIGSYDASIGGATPLVFLALGQAAGVATFIAGMVTTEKVLKFQFDQTTAVKLTPMVAPLADGGFGGLSGTF